MHITGPDVKVLSTRLLTNNPKNKKQVAGSNPSNSKPQSAALPSLPPGLGKVYFGNSGAMGGSSIVDHLDSVLGVAESQREEKIHEVLSFNEYLDKVYDNPKIARNATQRIFDMVTRQGVKQIEVDGEALFKYHFFENPVDPKNTLYGMEKPIHELMKQISSAAAGGSAKSKIILMVGPVGTAKTTIVNSLKDGLREYSKTDEGATYSIQWDFTGVEDLLKAGAPLYGLKKIEESPMNEDPLKLISNEPNTQGIKPREALFEKFNERLRQQSAGKSQAYNLKAEGDVSPHSRYIFNTLVQHYQKNGAGENAIKMALQHVKAKRIVLDENERVGIGTYEAKDEKSHRASQLTGTTNYRMLTKIGDDSHPLAFSYNGELNKANRGLAHLDELIKYPPEIWGVLLSAAQFRTIKPEENVALIPFDGLLIGTTNIPEWESKIKKNKKAEAIRDRIIPITVPYNTRLSDEIKIYEKQNVPAMNAKGRFVSPHLLTIAGLMAMMSRLSPPNKSELSLIDKVRLYDGQTVGKEVNDQTVRQLKADAPDWELLRGLSARQIGEALDRAMEYPDAVTKKTVTPYHLISAFEEMFNDPNASQSDEDRKQYLTNLDRLVKEIDRLYILDVKRAIAGDEKEMEKLHTQYLNNLRAWRNKEQIKNPLTGRMESWNDGFLKAIETEMGVSESYREGFRKDLLAKIGDYAIDGKNFNYDTDTGLRKAYENYLMKTNSDVAIPMDQLDKMDTANTDTRNKLKIVKDRLIKMGYNEESAKIAMARAASPLNRQTAL